MACQSSSAFSSGPLPGCFLVPYGIDGVHGRTSPHPGLTAWINSLREESRLGKQLPQQDSHVSLKLAHAVSKTASFSRTGDSSRPVACNQPMVEGSRGKGKGQHAQKLLTVAVDWSLSDTSCASKLKLASSVDDFDSDLSVGRRLPQKVGTELDATLVQSQGMSSQAVLIARILAQLANKPILEELEALLEHMVVVDDTNRFARVCMNLAKAICVEASHDASDQRHRDENKLDAIRTGDTAVTLDAIGVGHHLQSTSSVKKDEPLTRSDSSDNRAFAHLAKASPLPSVSFSLPSKISPPTHLHLSMLEKALDPVSRCRICPSGCPGGLRCWRGEISDSWDAMVPTSSDEQVPQLLFRHWKGKGQGHQGKGKGSTKDHQGDVESMTIECRDNVRGMPIGHKDVRLGCVKSGRRTCPAAGGA